MRILFWFRKDLRLDDNTGLAEAERDAGGDVVPFYASEPEILSRECALLTEMLVRMRARGEGPTLH